MTEVINMALNNSYDDENIVESQALTGKEQDYFVGYAERQGSYGGDGGVESPFASDIDDSRRLTPTLVGGGNTSDVSGVESPLASESPAFYADQKGMQSWILYGLFAYVFYKIMQ